MEDLNRCDKNFILFLNRQFRLKLKDPLHWDHALLLTGLDLFAIGRDGYTSNQIVGKSNEFKAYQFKVINSFKEKATISLLEFISNQSIAAA